MTADLQSFPDAVSLSRDKGRGVVAGSPGSTTAPTNPQRVATPRRVSATAISLIPLRLMAVLIRMLRRLAPRRLAKPSAGIATGAGARLSDFFGSKSFIVRPLQQATEFADDVVGDYPNLDPRFRAFLALPHGDQPIHEASNCFAQKTKRSTRVHGK